MELYDISQTLTEGMSVWPGDPEFRRQWVSRIQEGKESNVSAVHMGIHTGTHLDAPLHLNNTGSDIASVAIDHFIGGARVLDISSENCIRAADLGMLNWQGVRRVLFKTASCNLPVEALCQRYIFLHADAAEFIVQKGILLVGIDTPSVDALDSTNLPVHRILLEHGISILEGVCLGHVPSGDYELICLPLKLAGFDGSPVRAILRK
jgi:arylformamidase